MPAPKQIAAQRRQIATDLRRDLKKKDRARLTSLRAAIAAAKQEKKERIASVRSVCRAERGALKERAAQLRAELRELIASERQAARTSCSTNRENARADGNKRIGAASEAYRGARADVARERIWDPARDPLKRTRGRKEAARETRLRQSESDDEVRNNIPPELVQVWEKVKRGIRAGARRSRTEAFMEWVHDHPVSVWEIMDEKAAQDLARMQREEARLAREMKSGKRYQRSAAHLAADLTEIPF